MTIRSDSRFGAVARIRPCRQQTSAMCDEPGRRLRQLFT